MKTNVVRMTEWKNLYPIKKNNITIGMAIYGFNIVCKFRSTYQRP